MIDVIDEAIYDLIHNFKGGAPALAPLVGIRPGTLMNKANPDQDHQLTVREGVVIQQAQRKYHLLHAESLLLNHVAIPLGGYSDTSDIELLNTYAWLHEQIGALATTIRCALDDNIIIPSELRHIKKHGRAVVRAMLEMERRMEALCEQEHDY